MPEHETYDYEGALDAEFERLHRDIASSSNPPGAAGAVALARHRRRTTIGSVAAVVAVAVIATSAGIAVHRHDTAVGPADGSLPTPAALTPAVLSAATSGWTGGWSTITRDTDATLKANDQLNSLSCLDTADTKALDEPTGRGGGAFTTSVGQVAFLEGLEFKADSPDLVAAGAAMDDAVSSCDPTMTTSTSYGNSGRLSFYEVPGKAGEPDIQFWTARLDNRLALLVLAGAEDAPSPDTVATMDNALMAAIQSDATFKPTASLGIGTSSSSADDPAFDMLSEPQLSAAFGSWSSGLDIGSDSQGDMPKVPCTDGDAVRNASSASGLSLGSTGVESIYSLGSPTEAQAALGGLVDQLSSCNSTAYDVRTLPGPGSTSVTVATAGGDRPATVWAVQSDRFLAVIALGGGSNPPDSVSVAVGGLLADVLAHPQAQESGAPDPQKQGEPAASSSSSAAAPQP
jgi:hypothetical protein